MWMKGECIPQDWNRAVTAEKLPENRCGSFRINLWQFDPVANLFEGSVSRGTYDRTTRERYTRKLTSSVTRSFANEENIVAVFQQVMEKKFEIIKHVCVLVLIEYDG